MKKLAIAIILISYLASCGITTPKYLYAPNSPNTLVVQSKKDVLFQTSYASTRHQQQSGAFRQNSTGVDVKAAFGITNHIAIKLDGYQKWERDRAGGPQTELSSFNINYKRNGAQISGGYYGFIDNKKASTINVFTGFGIGRNQFSGKYRNTLVANNFFKANTTKWFITPSINLAVHKNYVIVLGTKYTLLRFNNIQTNDEELQQGIYTQIDKKNSAFLDLFMDHQFGFKDLNGVKFHAMLGTTNLTTTFNNTQPITNTNFENTNQYLYNNAYLSFGLIADIRLVFKK